MKKPTVIKFAPEYWGELDRFVYFYAETYNFKTATQKAVSGALNHCRKAVTLKNLAIKLVPNLELDKKELEANGYTPAINSSELSAVIEGIILELYSAIDCTRKIIQEIYGKYSGVPDSTRKLFQNAFDDKIDDRVPEILRKALKDAHWYTGFRKIRDELTHSDVGSCHMDSQTGKVSYMHTGFKIDGRALVIEDIFKKIDETFVDANQLLGKIYQYLNSTLSDNEVWQMCGVFGGRIYSRYVIPKKVVDFHSGRCDAYKWFEKEENPTCPFIENCGAYKNRNTNQADAADAKISSAD